MIPSRQGPTQHKEAFTEVKITVYTTLSRIKYYKKIKASYPIALPNQP